MICNNCGLHVRHGARFCPACGAPMLRHHDDKSFVVHAQAKDGSATLNARAHSVDVGKVVQTSFSPGIASSARSCDGKEPKSNSMGLSGRILLSFGIASIVLMLFPWVSLDPTTASKLHVIGINVPGLMAVTGSSSVLGGYLSQVVPPSKVAGAVGEATSLLGNFTFVYLLWSASVVCQAIGCLRLFLTKKEHPLALAGLALGVVCCAAFACEFSSVLQGLDDALSHIMFSLSPLYLACACVNASGLLVGLYLTRSALKDEQG